LIKKECKADLSILDQTKSGSYFHLFKWKKLNLNCDHSKKWIWENFCSHKNYDEWHFRTETKYEFWIIKNFF
jgi:hypothetical protein